MHPTPRALELAEPLGRALEEIGRTLDLSQQFDPAAYRGTLTVGLQEHAAMKLLPGLLSCLKAQAPDAKLDARVFRPRSDALAMLDAGEVDVSVSVPPQAAPGRIFTHPAFEERFVCVVRRDHPCVGESLSLDTFLTLQHLLVSPEGDRFGHTDTMLAERGLKRDLSVTVTQMYAAPPVIASSDLIATLMLGVVEASGWADRLRVLDPPIPLAPCSYVMAWHRRNDVHPAQRWLRRCIAAQQQP